MPPFLYFRTFINGNEIVSWGVDPAMKKSGTVHRVLFDPMERWYHHENGLTLQKAGIESHTLHFVPNPDRFFVAADGGLIEVRVHRATKRIRRSPALSKLRNGVRYGIGLSLQSPGFDSVVANMSPRRLPSNGLLELPEDTCYYSWVLQDPKHSPYASFQFHYRAWKNLKHLGILSNEICRPLGIQKRRSRGAYDCERAKQLEVHWQRRRRAGPHEIASSCSKECSTYEVGRNSKNSSCPQCNNERRATETMCQAPMALRKGGDCDAKLDLTERKSSKVSTLGIPRSNDIRASVLDLASHGTKTRICCGGMEDGSDIMLDLVVRGINFENETGRRPLPAIPTRETRRSACTSQPNHASEELVAKYA